MEMEEEEEKSVWQFAWVSGYVSGLTKIFYHIV